MLFSLVTQCYKADTNDELVPEVGVHGTPFNENNIQLASDETNDPNIPPLEEKEHIAENSTDTTDSQTKSNNTNVEGKF